jgi:hypothetical protein
MRILKPALWILLGVAIGATAIGSPRSVQAQQTSSQQRLKWIVVPSQIESVGVLRGRFIYDTLSKGCCARDITRSRMRPARRSATQDARPTAEPAFGRAR